MDAINPTVTITCEFYQHSDYQNVTTLEGFHKLIEGASKEVLFDKRSFILTGNKEGNIDLGSIQILNKPDSVKTEKKLLFSLYLRVNLDDDCIHPKNNPIDLNPDSTHIDNNPKKFSKNPKVPGSTRRFDSMRQGLSKSRDNLAQLFDNVYKQQNPNKEL